jgi:predicted small secreted protein
MNVKKILVLLMVLTLVMVGCETMQRVGETVNLVAQKVCNFDANMSSEAQMAMQFLSVASTVAGSVFLGTKFTAAQAMDVFNDIANASTTGACVFLEDFNGAMEYFNALSKQYKAQMAAKGKKDFVAVPSLINLNAKLSVEKRLAPAK